MRRNVAREILDAIAGRTVLVAGDLMLDEYIWGGTDRISPEAPVPVVQWDNRTFAPGGAANVVHNVVSLGGKSIACGAVGDDNSADELRQTLTELGADLSGIIEVRGRLTTRKTRVFARSQQLLRVDRETTDPIGGEATAALAETCATLLDSVDAVLFSDYAKGVLDAAWVQEVTRAAIRRGVTVTAGPKPTSVGIFAGATLLSFNRAELALAVDRSITDEESLVSAGKQLVESLGVTALVVTRGPEGAMLFEGNGAVEQVPPKAVQVFDECGAGDTFLTAATLALVAGRDFAEAIAFANVAAAAVVQKVGVFPATPEDILELCFNE